MESTKSSHKLKRKLAVCNGLMGSFGWLNIQFHDTMDPQKHAYFSSHLKRQSFEDESDVIILQDIKDVALFQVLTPLPSVFIDMFHTPQVDTFLRTLIIYFQAYLQVSNEMITRQNTLKGKLRSLQTNVYEARTQKFLSELRALVGRDYGSLLLGLGETGKYHHMANKLRTSDRQKDVRLFELLYRLCIRVVWIALGREGISIIEAEVNRLFRTHSFSKAIGSRGSFLLCVKRITDRKQEILDGETTKTRKLLAMSPAIEEFLYGFHNIQLFSLSAKNITHDDQKMRFLLAAQFLPEQQLSSLGIPVGILGMSRQQFDAMLVPVVPADESTVLRHSTMRRVSLHKKTVDLNFVIPSESTPHVIPIEFPETDVLANSRRKVAQILWRNHMSKMIKY